MREDKVNSVGSILRLQKFYKKDTKHKTRFKDGDIFLYYTHTLTHLTSTMLETSLHKFMSSKDTSFFIVIICSISITVVGYMKVTSTASTEFQYEQSLLSNKTVKRLQYTEGGMNNVC
jgi:hypothetical protein